MIVKPRLPAVLPWTESAGNSDVRLRLATKHDPENRKAGELLARIGKMEKAASEIRPYLFDLEKAGSIGPEDLKQINRLLISLERDFTDPQGIPRRPWYKHLVFGARYTYAVLCSRVDQASEAGDGPPVGVAIKFSRMPYRLRQARTDLGLAGKFRTMKPPLRQLASWVGFVINRKIIGCLQQPSSAEEGRHEKNACSRIGLVLLVFFALRRLWPGRKTGKLRHLRRPPNSKISRSPSSTTREAMMRSDLRSGPSSRTTCFARWGR
jgi:hypothetical protein